MKILVFVYVILSCADAGFILYEVHNFGVEELNPVINFFLQWSDVDFLIVKGLLTAISATILWLTRRLLCSKIVTIFLVVVYCILTLYHLIQVF